MRVLYRTNSPSDHAFESVNGVQFNQNATLGSSPLDLFVIFKVLGVLHS